MTVHINLLILVNNFHLGEPSVFYLFFYYLGK